MELKEAVNKEIERLEVVKTSLKAFGIKHCVASKAEQENALDGEIERLKSIVYDTESNNEKIYLRLYDAFGFLREEMKNGKKD